MSNIFHRDNFNSHSFKNTIYFKFKVFFLIKQFIQLIVKREEIFPFNIQFYVKHSLLIYFQEISVLCSLLTKIPFIEALLFHPRAIVVLKLVGILLNGFEQSIQNNNNSKTLTNKIIIISVSFFIGQVLERVGEVHYCVYTSQASHVL